MSRNNISISIENNEEIMEALGATEAQMKKAVKRNGGVQHKEKRHHGNTKIKKSRNHS